MKTPNANPISVFFPAVIFFCGNAMTAIPAPAVTGVDWQPLAAQVERIFEAMDYVGSPITPETKTEFEKMRAGTNPEPSVEAIQKLLDPLCLLLVEINPESRVKVARGAAAPELVEQGWRQFLVKVQNEAGVTSPLKAESPSAQKLAGSTEGQVANRC